MVPWTPPAPPLSQLSTRLLSVDRFDSRLQRALLQYGVFAAVEAKLGDSALGDGCATTVLEKAATMTAGKTVEGRRRG
ncbi:hypothetical protein GUJ93_ZPchr0001g30308 [Zizania palustris]|uniref:Uncharacterized protein n=1 Tax=Zizania palustris TaxID=103762 RepID=A0A8J5V620_ZIZPA|nr:hypothetical protein GUJ93_ZPchr0001g30308 [Zizania palustris]